MKNKKIIALLSLFLISSIFIGCGKDTDDVPTTNDSSIVDALKPPDDSPTIELPDDSVTDDVDDETDEDTTTEETQESSNTTQTIKYDGGQIDFPSDWIEYDFSTDMKIYLFANSQGNANILSDSTMGLSPEEYMVAAKNSVLQTLSVKDEVINTDSKDVNGVTVYYFEYAQDTPNGIVYTYQPTVFINDNVHILTIGSLNKDVIDSNKSLFEEIATTIKE